MPITPTLTTPPTYSAVQITMANAAEVVTLLGELYASHSVESSCAPVQVDGTADWQVTIHQPGYGEQRGNLHDWIVTGQSLPFGSVVLVYPEAVFASTFTVPAGS